MDPIEYALLLVLMAFHQLAEIPTSDATCPAREVELINGTTPVMAWPSPTALSGLCAIIADYREPVPQVAWNRYLSVPHPRPTSIEPFCPRRRAFRAVEG